MGNWSSRGIKGGKSFNGAAPARARNDDLRPRPLTDFQRRFNGAAPARARNENLGDQLTTSLTIARLQQGRARAGA